MIFKTLRISLLLSLIVLTLVVVSGQVFSHGSIYTPISRVFLCYLEGPESPDTLPCQDLVNMSGTQPLYDWNEVNIGTAGNNSRSIIPDGRLCSAGREKYYGLDAGRADWPMTVLPSGGPYTFQLAVTANHPIATFYFYVTKDGYDPNVPLRWSDLEDQPFATIANPTLDDMGLQWPVYQFNVTLPNKTGRHLIYNIWTRQDSLENFYSCSDVWFGNSPTPTPTLPAACTAPAWQSGTQYPAGSIVSHNNKEWESKWTNTEQPTTAGTSSVPWKLRGYCISGGTPQATPTRTPATMVPTNTPTRTNTPATMVGTNTPTRTPTRTATGPTPTRTNTRTPTRTPTVGGPTNTPTRTPTTGGPTNTPTRTPTSGGGGTCSPVTSTITAPFTFDGSGTFCWQSNNLGAYINSWNTTSVTLNGVNVTNVYVAAASYPAQIGGYWYVTYNSSVAWGHFEAK